MAPRRRRRRRRSKKLGPVGILVLIVLGLVVAYPGAALLVVVVAGVVWLVRRNMQESRKAEARAAVRERLLGYNVADLDNLSGIEFEAWIAAVLEREGFAIEDLPAGGDFGVDVIAGYGGVRFGIQAKRYGSNVGNSAVQEANAGSEYHHCQVPVVITQSGFTRAAREQAERMQPPCLLIGRDEISHMAALLKTRALG
ncbi:MAG: restriction endonuclease [Planctomycetota bacterium]|nr:restriction endonuclease [Planctomycetota bacterium]